MNRNYEKETICVQAGWQPKNGEPRILPIYQSTTFKYETSEQMGKLFDLEESGYFYSRLQNPTNDYVAEKTVNTHRNYDIYEYVDLTEKFLNVSKKYISINFCLKEYRNLLNEIRALEHSSRTVFYIDSNIDQRVRFLYVCVASILTFESFNFEIPDDLSMVYISNLQKIQDRNYMILSDYLRKIANPVSIGISLYGVRAYVCVLNHEPGESVYKQKDFELSMITTEVDDSLALVGLSLIHI